jgi:transcriptional regulator NrdR family protein
MFSEQTLFVWRVRLPKVRGHICYWCQSSNVSVNYGDDGPMVARGVSIGIAECDECGGVSEVRRSFEPFIKVRHSNSETEILSPFRREKLHKSASLALKRTFKSYREVVPLVCTSRIRKLDFKRPDATAELLAREVGDRVVEQLHEILASQNDPVPIVDSNLLLYFVLSTLRPIDEFARDKFAAHSALVHHQLGKGHGEGTIEIVDGILSILRPIAASMVAHLPTDDLLVDKSLSVRKYRCGFCAAGRLLTRNTKYASGPGSRRYMECDTCHRYTILTISDDPPLLLRKLNGEPEEFDRSKLIVAVEHSLKKLPLRGNDANPIDTAVISEDVAREAALAASKFARLEDTQWGRRLILDGQVLEGYKLHFLDKEHPISFLRGALSSTWVLKHLRPDDFRRITESFDRLFDLYFKDLVPDWVTRYSNFRSADRKEAVA